MLKRIPIGVSDFKEIVSENYYYIDKSLFINEIIQDGSKVILLPRPRRFGKTLNMSMLKYFFEKPEDRVLFEDLKIKSCKEIMDKQGKYPVIYITFKDEKYSNWQDLKSGLTKLIIDEFGKYEHLLRSDTLANFEKEEFNNILNGKADYATYLKGLKTLTKYIHKHYNQKIVILIDEYDVPIQSGYVHGYYDEIIDFMRVFLSSGLKDNEYLEKAVLTGIMRVAKESIFSGLNNLKVSTLLKESYSEHFGFTEEEVENTLNYYGIEYEIDEVKRWYNGYIFGDTVIYNPWSILNYVDNFKEGFKPHWVNTSSNDLVKFVLTKGGEKIQRELEELIQGRELIKIINEDIVMSDIAKSSENVWSFLLFSGYLKSINKELKNGRLYCTLKIPNLEVQCLYEDIILDWLKENVNNDRFDFMLQSLVNGEIEAFSGIFEEFVLNSVSYFDVSGNESEKVYHAFVLGMLVALSEDYEVKSNLESGYGRYDVMIIPRNNDKKGIIIEFKKVSKRENLEQAALSALKQIQDKKYRQQLLDRGINDILELAIAFEGKEVLVREL